MGREPKPKVDATATSGEQTARSRSDEKRKTSREYTKPEDIQLSPRPRRNLFTGEVLAGELLPPGSPDAQFLAKVSEFVSKNGADLSQCQPTFWEFLPHQPGPASPRPLADRSLTQQAALKSSVPVWSGTILPQSQTRTGR